MDPNKLRIPCKKINKETNMKKLWPKIQDAVKLMRKNKGCGIAANQIGVYKQFFAAIIDIGDDDLKIKIFMNPDIISHSEETIDEVEGCLSYPKQFGTVTRWKEITVKYMNSDGKIVTETYSDMNARVIQHETDHLNGICCMDIARDIFIKEPEEVKEEVEGE